MAILRLRPELKEVDDEYFSEKYAQCSDSDEFIELRKKYYEYQYKFSLHEKNIDKDLIDFYRKLATDELAQTFYGATKDYNSTFALADLS